MVRFWGMRLFIYLSMLGLLHSCASVSRPTGGVKDKTPPKLDTIKSSPLNPTNFTKKDIELNFDEYITLQDLFKNLLISPPLDPNPEIKVRGKSLIIHFQDEDTLAANTTYQIQFGNAIKDLNEGNPYPNFTYIFSTGEALDSLTFICTAIDAVSNQPLGKILIALYTDNRDSTPIAHKPNYAGKTNDAGTVTLQYLKEGVYYVSAWKDDNSDFLYQPESESFGFIQDSLVLQAGVVKSANVRISLKDKKLLPPEIDTIIPGKIVMNFNKTPENFEWKIEPEQPATNSWIDNDKINILHQSSDSLGRILYLSAPDFKDTILITSRPGRLFKEKIKVTSSPKNESPIPDPNWNIHFTLPIRTIDSSKIQLVQGASRRPTTFAIKLDSMQRYLGIDSKWVPDSAYQITFLPGAITDWFGNANDSIQVPFRITDVALYGNIVLSIEELDSSKSVIVQLKLKERIVRELKWEAGRKDSIILKNILPDTYEIWVIYDENGNGRWDPASNTTRKHAEHIYRKMLEPLRANWDLEVHITPEISPSNYDFIRN